jgi:hypothetical protein
LPQSLGFNRDERDLFLDRYFEADCQATDLVGDFVYVTGAAAFPQVTRVDPRNLATMPAVGVLFEKTSATHGLVLRQGELPSVGLVPGAGYFIGADGRLAQLAPAPLAGGLAVVQRVGTALTSTRLALEIGAAPGIRRG